jgi:hypothetical protein
MAGLLIPYGELSPEALRGVIEEFVTREGTDARQKFPWIRRCIRCLNSYIPERPSLYLTRRRRPVIYCPREISNVEH